MSEKINCPTCKEQLTFTRNFSYYCVKCKKDYHICQASGKISDGIAFTCNKCIPCTKFPKMMEEELRYKHAQKSLEKTKE